MLSWTSNNTICIFILLEIGSLYFSVIPFLPEISLWNNKGDYYAIYIPTRKVWECLSSYTLSLIFWIFPSLIGKKWLFNLVLIFIFLIISFFPVSYLLIFLFVKILYILRKLVICAICISDSFLCLLFLKLVIMVYFIRFFYSHWQKYWPGHIPLIYY